MEAESAVEQAVKDCRDFTDKLYDESGKKKPEFFDGEKLKTNYQKEWDELESKMQEKFNVRNEVSLAWMICEIERAKALIR